MEKYKYMACHKFPNVDKHLHFQYCDANVKVWVDTVQSCSYKYSTGFYTRYLSGLSTISKLN